MRRSALLLPALSLLAAFSASAARRPVAHWDVVPYQRVTEPFKAGVVAFYDAPFKVEFTVNGAKAAECAEASMNDRTRVVEHWFVLDPAKYNAAKLKEAKLVLGAKAVAADGTSYALPDIVMYRDTAGDVGSHRTIWLDPYDGIDYSEGTREAPVKSMRQAVKLAGDGGTVVLMKAGTYTAERIGSGNNRRYWTTIRPADGLTRKDVLVKGGRTGCDKLRFSGVQIFADVNGDQGYVLAGVNDKSICWLENCIVFNKGGRSVARTFVFGNKLVGYVTGGATTDMGNGPCCRLVRNHVIKSISADAFTASDCLAVNCILKDVDPTGVVEEPAFHRSLGLHGAWTHDVILANIKATECACNGFVGLKLRDSVFSNITLDTTGPEGKFVSRYAREMENVWFDRVKVTGQDWVWFKAPNHKGDFAPTDVRVTDCPFTLPPKEDD